MARKHLEHEPSLLALPEAKRQKKINKILAGPARTYFKQFEEFIEKRELQQARPKPERIKHLIWTARYQVAEVERKTIAEGPPSVTIDLVKQTISRTLKHLGLRSRKSQGRPQSLPL